MKLSTVMSGVVVRPRANGCIEVQPRYRAKPIERGATPVGVLTRLAVATEIERLLNKECKR